ncbi:MAG: hypothetical protein QW470_02070 [Candidatus Caldarchaeum sp.]
MSLLFITNYEMDITLALHLAKMGSGIVFYSPNPYILSQALQHSIRTHYTVSKPEFIKLCAEGRFKTTQQLPKNVDEVWISVNTMKGGVDTYADSENLLRRAAQEINEAKTLTVAGLTKPGEAPKLIELFHSTSRALECPVFFMGSPQTIWNKIPAWSSGGKATAAINFFNPCFFNNIESAECATVSLLAMEAVKRITLLHLSRHFKNQEIIHNCLHDNVFLRAEHLDVLKYLKTKAGINGVYSSFFTNSYKSLVKELARIESEIAMDVLKLARKSGKTVRVLVVCFEDAVMERLQTYFAKKNVKAVRVDESSLESKGVEMCKGFDGVILASQHLKLWREFEKACKQVWFLPIT